MRFNFNNPAKGITSRLLGLLVAALLLGNLLVVGQNLIEPREAFADRVPIVPKPPQYTPGELYHGIFTCNLYCVCPAIGLGNCKCWGLPT